MHLKFKACITSRNILAAAKPKIIQRWKFCCHDLPSTWGKGNCLQTLPANLGKRTFENLFMMPDGVVYTYMSSFQIRSNAIL